MQQLYMQKDHSQISVLCYEATILIKSWTERTQKTPYPTPLTSTPPPYNVRLQSVTSHDNIW